MMKKILILAAMLLALTGCGRGSSVGIIGGADGPTAVFVSGNAFPLIVVLAAAAVLVIVIVMAIVFSKRGR